MSRRRLAPRSRPGQYNISNLLSLLWRVAVMARPHRSPATSVISVESPQPRTRTGPRPAVSRPTGPSRTGHRLSVTPPAQRDQRLEVPVGAALGALDHVVDVEAAAAAAGLAAPARAGALTAERHDRRRAAR